jgi:hypothetical protein
VQYAARMPLDWLKTFVEALDARVD